jgi:MFS family permease
VQEYIDELPAWADGTSLKSAPITGMQWLIWSLAAAGKFFEGYVVFMTGVALPLIVRDFHIAAAEKGIVSAGSLAGIVFGAVLLGGLSDYFGLVGIVFAVALADKVGRIKLQIFGSIGCALGLLVASFSIDFGGTAQIALIFAGFMLFNFMTNIGPNAQTYLLAGEVFPTEVRGMGAGFAAAFAKIGAVATAFLFPILLVAIGTRALLYGLIVTSILGAVVTWLYRIETTGVNLDRIGR